MGGIAATIDWDRTVDARDIEPMLDLIPHRATGGTGRIAFDHAALAETHTIHVAADTSTVTTVEDLAIVADLRLWHREGLQARAGGRAATVGMDDRRLLLEAYRRTGIGFLDDVAGDFAFVIWDNSERRALAVRDRFAVKPLFFERTAGGIRIASEPKQLVATSRRPVEPCARSIVEYVVGRFQETRFTFFEGIERVRPSTALVIDPSGDRTHHYWNPGRDTVPQPAAHDLTEGFREQLVDSVGHRVNSSAATVSHLSGGLDSPSISAAAQILKERGRLGSPFYTASAVYPGYELDESRWIADIAARQSFGHHDYIPRVDPTEAYAADMWIADQPRVNRIRDLWVATSDIAAPLDADLVLDGIGGDEVASQDQVFLDRMRDGSVVDRLRDARSYLMWSRRGFARAATSSARDVLPSGLKRAVRKMAPHRDLSQNRLIRSEAWEQLAAQPIEGAPFEYDFPSLAQVAAVATTQHPEISWINELQEAEYASRGIGLSSPFLDRSVVEYVASIPSTLRPVDGRSKTLIRQGFMRDLPPSVFNRRTKTIADDYLDMLLALHGRYYRDRYPEISDAGARYLDADQYDSLLRKSKMGPVTPLTRESLWSAWTVMEWLDGLDRYH